jgi:hypothetical protein
VNLDGDFARAEPPGDLLVWHTGDDQPHDFALASTQRRVTGLQRRELVRLPARDAVPFQCLVDRVKQRLIAEGLGQDFTAPDFMARTVVGMSP